MTPILPCPSLGAAIGLKNLIVKERISASNRQLQEPGANHRNLDVQAVRHQARRHPHRGKRGRAMAAYAARAGIEAYVFMPRDTPLINQVEAVLAGAKVFLVDGLNQRLREIVNAGSDPMGWFDISTLKEPYRVEGKKTMGSSWPSRAAGSSRRHPLPHRRGHRPGWHVEGLRRASRAGLDEIR